MIENLQMLIIFCKSVMRDIADLLFGILFGHIN